MQKGESIKDTTQTLASYCDAIVLRHPMKGAAETAVSVSNKPIINAGESNDFYLVLGTITQASRVERFYTDLPQINLIEKIGLTFACK